MSILLYGGHITAIRDHIIAIIKWAFLTEMAWALKTTTTYKSINSLLLLSFVIFSFFLYYTTSKLQPKSKHNILWHIKISRVYPVYKIYLNEIPPLTRSYHNYQSSREVKRDREREKEKAHESKGVLKALERGLKRSFNQNRPPELTLSNGMTIDLSISIYLSSHPRLNCTTTPTLPSF